MLNIAHHLAALLIGISQLKLRRRWFVFMHERVESAHLIQQPRQADTRHLRLEGQEGKFFGDETDNGSGYTVAFF